MSLDNSAYDLLDQTDTPAPVETPPAPQLPQHEIDNSNVDPALEDALIQQESSGNPNAISYAGAKGVGQLMDRTGKQLAAARGVSYDPYNPDQNKQLSTDYLSTQLKRFGSEDLALTAYNAGPEKLARLQKLAGSNKLEDVLKIPESEGGLKGEQRVYAQKILAKRNNSNGEAADYSSQFNTGLTSDEKTQYDTWVADQSAKQGRDVGKDTFDYDLQGFWKSNPNFDWQHGAHLTDQFKKPNHPTFSDQSQYSNETTPGGHWEGEKFTPASKNKVPTNVDDDPLRQLTAKVPDLLNSVDSTAQGFAKVVAPIVSDPMFNTLPFDSQANLVSQIYGAKTWDKGTSDVFKNGMNHIWDAADPRDLPNLNDVIGAPPVVPAGKDPETELGKWKTTAVQNLLYNGTNPAIYGTHLDDYLTNASKAETEAFGIRNQSTLGRYAGNTGNFVRDISKGALNIVVDPVAGLVRGGNTPLDYLHIFGIAEAMQDYRNEFTPEARAKAADAIQNLPQYLGKPSQSYLYATDPSGNLLLNSDGTPKTKPEDFASKAWSSAGQLIGNVGGFVTGGAVLKSYGMATSSIAALAGGLNWLGISNSSYKSVYDQTNGDVEKAYRASMFAAPAGAAIQSLGEVGAIARFMSPAFSTMSKFDKLRYLGQSFAKNATLGAVTMGGADIVQQAAESSQTGQAFSPERAGIAAASGALAVGVPGAAVDYIGGNQSRAQTDALIVKFGNSISQQVEVNSKEISKDLLNLYAIDAAPTGKGTVLLTKRANAVPIEATIPELTQTLQSIPHPNEIIAMGQRQGELASKDTRTADEETELQKLNQQIPAYTAPEHLNTIKAVENVIAGKLSEDPSALMARYDSEKAKWVNPETGEEQPHLKDLLFKPKPEELVFSKDLSDISHIKILDEEALRTAATEPPKAIATEENINLQRSLDKVNTELLKLRNQKDAIDPADKESKKAAQLYINDKLQEKRDIQANQLKLKPALDIEQAEQEKLKQEQKQKEADLKTVEKIKKKGLGAIITDESGTQIAISSGLTPEAKAQVTAHEIGHAITDKVELSDVAKTAVANKLNELKSKGTVASASDIANEVMLPKAREQVKIPDTVANKLTPKSREALYSEREFLANQLGAIMLKRSGADIGDYKILPEIEDSLRNTKLPELPGTKAKEQTVETQTTQPAQTSEDATPPIKGEQTTFNLNTGEQKETAFSKTLSESNPAHPKTMYDVASRIQGLPEARAFIEKHGLEKATEIMEHPDNFSIEPRSRSILADEILDQTRNKLNADPTPENREAFHRAEQVRAAVGTTAGQQLGLLRRFRAAKDFPELIAAMDKAYRDAGQEPPAYTEYMLKELKAKFEKVNKLPEGQFKNSQYQKLFETTLKDKKTSWGDFLSNYVRTNLLSGAGTQAITGISGFWMGPIVTALSHPFQAGGLMWRSMWNIKDVAAANYMNELRGTTGRSLFSGLVSGSPLVEGNSSSVAGILASFYNKFGKYVYRGLAATHEFQKTLSGEGYLASKKYAELKAKYGDDPARLSAETAKLIVSKEDKASAVTQAKKEAADAGVPMTESEAYARAYEIMHQDTDPNLIAEATDWARTVSHVGKVANPIQVLARGLFNSPIWNTHPYLSKVRLIVQPFGKAMIALSDFAQDFIPGNIVLDKLYRDLPNYFSPGSVEPRSPALAARLKAGQAIGSVFAATALGLARAGAFKITGDPEKPLGTNKGEKAYSRSDIKTGQQTGEPEYSIIFPNGKSIEYKDFPGLNAVLYGLYRFNKALDGGSDLLGSTAQFYKGSFSYAVPFFGGGTLNSPILTLGNDLLNPESTETRVQKAFEDFAVSSAKMLTPFSSMLRDIQHIYDSTPEETHQTLVQKMFKDVPGVSSLVGSQNAVDRFGDPVTRTPFERVPGASRVLGEVTPPSNEVWGKLRDKGLFVRDMGNTEHFFPSSSKPKPEQTTFEADRSTRLNKAYANSFTPDEWNSFRKATGPYIKTAAEEIANTDLPTDTAQELLNKRVSAIETQAKKYYVLTGKWYP